MTYVILPGFRKAGLLHSNFIYHFAFWSLLVDFFR